MGRFAQDPCLWPISARSTVVVCFPAGAADPAEGHVQALPDRPLRDVRARRARAGHGLVAEPPAVTAQQLRAPWLRQPSTAVQTQPAPALRYPDLRMPHGSSCIMYP